MRVFVRRILGMELNAAQRPAAMAQRLNRAFIRLTKIDEVRTERRQHQVVKLSDVEARRQPVEQRIRFHINVTQTVLHEPTIARLGERIVFLRAQITHRLYPATEHRSHVLKTSAEAELRDVDVLNNLSKAVQRKRHGPAPRPPL